MFINEYILKQVGNYPAVVHKPCGEQVATGNIDMARVLRKIEEHRCEK